MSQAGGTAAVLPTAPIGHAGRWITDATGRVVVRAARSRWSMVGYFAGQRQDEHQGDEHEPQIGQQS
jgi:hypothetical protein